MLCTNALRISLAIALAIFLFIIPSRAAWALSFTTADANVFITCDQVVSSTCDGLSATGEFFQVDADTIELHITNTSTTSEVGAYQQLTGIAWDGTNLADIRTTDPGDADATGETLLNPKGAVLADVDNFWGAKNDGVPASGPFFNPDLVGSFTPDATVATLNSSVIGGYTFGDQLISSEKSTLGVNWGISSALSGGPGGLTAIEDTLWFTIELASADPDYVDNIGPSLYLTAHPKPFLNPLPCCYWAPA